MLRKRIRGGPTVRRTVVEIVERTSFDASPKESIDGAYHVTVLAGHQRESVTFSGSPSSSADPVDVGFGSVGDIIIDDM